MYLTIQHMFIFSDDAESSATAEPGPASQENQTPAQALSLVCEE